MPDYNTRCINPYHLVYVADFMLHFAFKIFIWRDKVMLDTLSPIILWMYRSFRSFIYDYTQFSVSFLMDPFLFDKKNITT